MSDSVKRLQLLIEAKGSTAGLVGLKREMGGMFDAQKTAALKAKMHWQEAETAASRAAKAQVRAVESVTKAEERAAQIRLRWTQAVEKGNTAAAARYELAWTQAIRRVSTAQEAAAGARGLTGTTAAQAAAARGGYTRARVVGAVAGGIGALGTGVMGLGALGIGAGFELGKAGMNWQTYAAQQRANSPMTDADFRAYQRRAFALAVASGARPEDILLAERYGAERGYSGGANRGVLQAGLMLGLPSGGTEALAPSEQAIITLMKNFPSLRGNAKKAAGMILAAAQNSAGTTVPEFVNAIPQTLVSAGHYGPKNGPDALAIIAALTQAGVPIDEANTQAYNLILRTAKPTPAVQKFLAGLKKDKGIDLTRDFTPQGVSDKGIINVLQDIKKANLDPSTLGHLFPYMRAYLGALGLTGNFSTSALNIRGRITGGAGDQALDQNYKRYLGLDSTKAKELEQQFNVMSKTLGMSLLPGILQLEKELIPLGKNFSQWTRENKGTITSLIEMSPKILLIGAGLKGIGLAFKTYNLIQDTGLLAGAFRGLSGAIGGFTAKKAVVKTAFSVVGEEAAAAAGASGTVTVGAEGAAVAGGAGVLGLASAFVAAGIAATAVSVAISKIGDAMNKIPGAKGMGDAAILSIPIIGPLIEGARKGYQVDQNILNQIFGGGSNAGSAGQAGKGNDSGPGWNGYPNVTAGQWTTGQGKAGISGSAFGNFDNPANNIQNRLLDSSRQGFYHQTLGGHGPYYDTDFPNKGGKAWQPVHLPGGSHDIWTFAGRILDSRVGGTGGMGEIWITPQGHKLLLWHLGRSADGELHEHPHGRDVYYHGSYHTPQPGNKYPGGTQIGYAGFAEIWHLCVVTSAEGRKDLMQLMGGGRNRPAGRGGAPSIPSGGLNLFGSEKPYAKSFAQAGSQSHIDPSVLAGVGMIESSGKIGSGVVSSSGYGSMGVAATPGAAKNSGSPNYGTGAGGQIGGAGQQLHKWWNWLASNPKFVAAHSGVAKRVLLGFGFKNPSQNQIMLVLALACFNAGPGSAHFDDASPGDGHGMWYAMRVLSESIAANNGHFPASYYTGQGPNRVPTNPGGQVHYDGPQTTKTAADWASYWGGLASDTANTMAATFPGVINDKHDPRKLPAWKKSIFIKEARREAFDQYQQYRSTIMGAPNLTKDEKRRLISAAWERFMQRYKSPLAEYVAKPPQHTPSEWAGYWSGLASDTSGSMSSFFPGVINGNKDPRTLPKWKRQIFDKLAQRKAYDEYEQYHSTVMADPNLTQAEKRRLISAAWNHYMYRHGHPEAEYIKRNRDNNMAQIRSDFLVGREAYKPPHSHPTAHPGKKPHPLHNDTKVIARSSQNQEKWLKLIWQALLRMEKGGSDPRQHGQTMLHSPGH